MSAHHHPALAAVAFDATMIVSLCRQTAVLAQLAGFIVTGFTIGMAPASAELTRGALELLLQRASE